MFVVPLRVLQHVLGVVVALRGLESPFTDLGSQFDAMAKGEGPTTKLGTLIVCLRNLESYSKFTTRRASRN